MAPSTYFVWGADSAHGVHVFRMMRGVMAPIGGCHTELLGYGTKHVFRMRGWQCTWCACISYEALGYGTNRGLPRGVAGVRAPIVYFVWGAGSAHGVHVFRMNSIRVTLHVFCMPQSFFANFYTMLSLHVSCMTHRAKPTSMYSV